MDLRPAKTRVERDRVGNAVATVESAQEGGCLGRGGDAQPRPLVVGRKLNVTERVASNVLPRRSASPRVDRRRHGDMAGNTRAR